MDSFPMRTEGVGLRSRGPARALRYRMAADQLGGSRDVGTLLHGERQVLEMIATGAPLASVLDELCRVIDQRSKLMSAVFLLDDSREHPTSPAGPPLPDRWRPVPRPRPLP